jgi:endonuclease YncB( thermonuclease family)
MSCSWGGVPPAERASGCDVGAGGWAELFIDDIIYHRRNTVNRFKKQFLISLLVLIYFLLHPNTGYGKTEITGRVVQVHDGDTITVQTEEKKVKIRLAEIDAPELKQEFGQVAQKYLEQTLLGTNVRIEQKSVDLYGRVIGKVFLGNEYVNETLVEEGYAWVYRTYTRRKVLIAKEDTARIEKRGLWYFLNPTPPWEWRKWQK